MQAAAENLAGLSGRVLEVGAGTGTNFEFYPETVARSSRSSRSAGWPYRAEGGRAAPVPVTVTTDTVEQFATDEPFDAVVCSLVLCSVEEPDSVVRQLFSLLTPGGELRYLEHVASSGCASAAAAGRRDGVATAGGQLSHTSAHRADDRRCRLSDRAGPARLAVAPVGADAVDGGRHRPGRQSRVANRAARAAAAAAQAGRPRRFLAARPWRRRTAACAPGSPR